MDWTKQAGAGPATYQEFLAPAMFEPCAELLLDAVGVGEGARVLDVACGTGVVSRAAARRAGSSGLVVGVDLGPPMIEVARSIPAEDGAAPIDYHQGDAGALPVPDAAFDIVVCQHGLQFFPDREGALAEMRRACVPGGAIGIACWTDLENAPSFVGVAEALRTVVGEQAGAMMQAPFGLGADELGPLMERSGLQDVSVKREVIRAHFASFEAFAPKAIGAGPLAPVVAELPEETQNELFADITRRLEPFRSPDGGVVGPMTTGIGVGRN